MKKSDGRSLDSIILMIEGMTLAVFKMQRMIAFYANVFGVEFEEKEMLGASIYRATFDHFNLMFCPADIAGINAGQNRHQFDIIVYDLEKTLKKAVEFGGEIIGEIAETESCKCVGIYDPDKNSMVLKERKQDD